MLRPLASMFRTEKYPDLLVGLEVSDDAAVYRITDDVAVIQTVDFFTPVVDDPYDYGAIAAANAMSDIYAMGGEVALALNISGFPADLPSEIVAEILRGGAEVVAPPGAGDLWRPGRVEDDAVGRSAGQGRRVVQHAGAGAGPSSVGLPGAVHEVGCAHVSGRVFCPGVRADG